jgi:hypothetical protein
VCEREREREREREELLLMNQEECDWRETLYSLKKLFWPYPEVLLQNMPLGRSRKTRWD